MGEYKRIEIIVGLFVFLGIIAASWMALKLGQTGGLKGSGYELSAVFSDAGGVREGSDVMLAGVVIGNVSNVQLIQSEKAKLTLMINNGVELTEDAIASIRTKGIIGERYVRIMQGGASDMLASGSEIEETESAINLEDLVSKYIFSTNK